MTDLSAQQIKRLTKICDKHQDGGLEDIAGITRLEKDRDDYQDEPLYQHPKFAVHCTLIVAAMLMAGSSIGLTWCIAVFPAQALVTALLITTALFGLWLFTSVEDQL